MKRLEILLAKGPLKPLSAPAHTVGDIYVKRINKEAGE